MELLIRIGRREKGEGRREKGEGRREKGEGRREKVGYEGGYM